ncbi:hypothetical protein BDV93DRAFT_563958 [Ceratobasidium sp. AG-I]|nr:hypothetical protein BDV93DRAFT_563958 [Ceratobasidium sp. AG-I]
MLWGMFWFIFAIISCAYSSGLPGVSRQYSVAIRFVSLGFTLALAIVGVFVAYFFYGIWLSPPATVAQPQSAPIQPAATAINMVTAQGGNPLMQMSGDQRIEPLSQMSELQPIQAGHPLKGGYGMPQPQLDNPTYHTAPNTLQLPRESERSQAEPIVHYPMAYRPPLVSAYSLAPPYSSAPGYPSISTYNTQPGALPPGGVPST